MWFLSWWGELLGWCLARRWRHPCRNVNCVVVLPACWLVLRCSQVGRPCGSLSSKQDTACRSGAPYLARGAALISVFSLQALLQGGLLIIPLLLLSVTVVSIGVERLRFWWDWRRKGDARLRQLVEELAGQSEVRARLHQQLVTERLHLRLSRWDAVLDLCIVLGPMLGLLAAVIGVMRLLASLGPDLVMPAATSPLLASYGQVLVGSAIGLTVALMALLVQRLCRMRRDEVLSRFAHACLKQRGEAL